MSARLESVSINLGLDVRVLGSVGLEPSDVDLNVEVTNVADDGILGHGVEVLTDNDVSATGGGNEDVSLRSGILHGSNLETGHSSLESVDGVDFGDDNTGTVGSERLGTLKNAKKRSISLKVERHVERSDLLPFRHHRNQRQQRLYQRA